MPPASDAERVEPLGTLTVGGGPPLLLLHATLSSAPDLRGLAQRLGSAYRVTSVDRRGTLASPLPRGARPGPIDVGVHVADLAALVERERWAPVTVVGHSYGGCLALELAARHPKLVASVWAYEPPYAPLGGPDTRARLEGIGRETAAAYEAGGLGRAAARGLGDAAEADVLENAAEADVLGDAAEADVLGDAAEARGLGDAAEARGLGDAAEAFLAGVAGAAAVRALPPAAREHIRAQGTAALADAALLGLEPDRLDRIVAPVTVATGGASAPFYAEVAEGLVARVRGARHRRIPNVDHMAPVTRPAIIAEAILEDVP